MNFVDGTIFIVETPKKDGDYCFRPMSEPEEEESAEYQFYRDQISLPTTGREKLEKLDSALLSKPE